MLDISNVNVRHFDIRHLNSRSVDQLFAKATHVGELLVDVNHSFHFFTALSVEEDKTEKNLQLFPPKMWTELIKR